MVYEKKSTETKNAIKMALLSILEEKPFSSISINDIATATHINRGTFYYHYADKFELIENIENDFFNELNNVHDAILAKSSVNPLEDFESYRFLPDFFELVENNSYVLKQLLSANGDPMFERHLRNNLKNIISESIETTDISKNSQQTALVFDFITSACLTVINFWLEHPEISKESIITTLTMLLTQGPVNTLLNKREF